MLPADSPIPSIVLGSSLVALCYNIFHALMIQHTSAVATTVLGQVKIIGIITVSCFLLGKSLPL